MSVMQTLFVLVPALVMLACGFFPAELANSKFRSLRKFVANLAAVQCLGAIVALGFSLGRLLRGDGPVTIELIPSFASLYLDGFSLLMLSLVSFVGFVVTRYSIRYLDGDAKQGSFFRWLAMTIGGVSVFVVSGNLLMLFAAWVLTSYGLHRLLLHYSDRPAASKAAWTKFAFSRIGDLLFVAAIALIYREFGSLELATVFADLETAAGSWSLTAIAWLLMVSAATKSAQFPFHSWLPNTLEAPTPVSALMHAGIVNAGGYLVIRLSPLIVEAPAALGVLAIVGSITVAYAGIVMMTQTSIKRSLAYSTIAQMGFMMLQCGVGAFSAAMLHILAHSLYKAYAFLNSGSVLTEAEGRRAPKPEILRSMHAADYAGGITLAFASVVGCSMLFGINLLAKPGGLAIGFVLTLAISTWLWDVFRLNSLRSTATGLVTAGGVSMLYMAGFFAVNQVVAESVPPYSIWLHANYRDDGRLRRLLRALHFELFACHETGARDFGSAPLHASNGFYVDAITQRVFSFRRS